MTRFKSLLDVRFATPARGGPSGAEVRRAVATPRALAYHPLENPWVRADAGVTRDPMIARTAAAPHFPLEGL